MTRYRKHVRTSSHVNPEDDIKDAAAAARGDTAWRTGAFGGATAAVTRAGADGDGNLELIATKGGMSSSSATSRTFGEDS